MNNGTCTLKTALVGLFPYAIVQVVDPEEKVAQVDLGGFPPNDADSLALVAKALRASAAGVRAHRRHVIREERKARRAARKAHCAE